MPVSAERRAALRRLVARFTLVSRRHGIKACGRDAGLDDVRAFRRRLLLRLHADRGGSSKDDCPVPPVGPLLGARHALWARCWPSGGALWAPAALLLFPAREFRSTGARRSAVPPVGPLLGSGGAQR
jgi:hypothetical protein